MLKRLENYYKREDDKFVQIIRDSDYAKKHLSNLYQGRKTISIVFLVVALFMILFSVFFSPSGDTGFFLWLLTLILLLFMAVDVQIKMILMINYIKSTFNSNNGTTPEQSKNH